MKNKSHQIKLVVFSLLAVILWAFSPKKKQVNFQVGEEYSYRVKYGIFTIGSATVSVDNKIHSVNNRPCYKIGIFGRTEGLTDLFKVRNNYVSYTDTASLLPQKFEYSARENSYKRDQILYFNRNKDEVVKVENNAAITYKVPSNIHDVISAYYSLRSVDFSKYSIGQTYSAPLFFDDEFYRFNVRYAGKSVINTRLGKIKVLKLNPVLPNNKLFKGENAIRVWVTDDNNRIPVRIETDFSFGTIVMEMRKHKKNLYHLDWF